MSEIHARLEDLIERLGPSAAALVLESSGIEVAAAGHADFEIASAEFAELWRNLRATETVDDEGPIRQVSIVNASGCWVLFPLGREYLLSVRADRGVPPGKIGFYAGEWVADHRGEFE